MSRWSYSILAWAGTILAGTAYLQGGAPQSREAIEQLKSRPPLDATPPAADFQQSFSTRAETGDLAFARALTDRYCVGCHNTRTKTAGLALDTADLGTVTESPELWEKVVRKLRDGAMPPVGVPNRPDKASYDRFATLLETRLDSGKPNPGRPVVHRLNRVEYATVIRDLLALDVDAAALLPADESGYGFDNIADVLSISPSLLERYMFAAQRISS